VGSGQVAWLLAPPLVRYLPQYMSGAHAEGSMHGHIAGLCIPVVSALTVLTNITAYMPSLGN
jgi:hypothetical protein